MPQTVIWLDKPESHDYQAAEDYLSLIMSVKQAAEYRQKLSDARDDVTHRKAKDILRASQLPLLAEDSKHVADDLAKVNTGQARVPGPPQAGRTTASARPQVRPNRTSPTP